MQNYFLGQWKFMKITKLKQNEIFVFGSNEYGIHGAGAALFAKNNFGAIQNCGYGLQGQSFAIPTKDKNIKTLPLWAINNYIIAFRIYAIRAKHLIFLVTPIGCGLAGYKYADIAPMFINMPTNVILPPEFTMMEQETT